MRHHEQQRQQQQSSNTFNLNKFNANNIQVVMAFGRPAPNKKHHYFYFPLHCKKKMLRDGMEEMQETKNRKEKQHIICKA